jgi:hypothetical protein
MANDEGKKDIVYPKWGASVLIALDPDEAPAFRAPAGTRLAFEGQLDQALYVYVAQIADADKTVTILWPHNGGSMLLPAGEPVRIPSHNRWLVTTARSHVRVVAAPRTLTRAEIAAELGGKEPPPGSVTTKGGEHQEDEPTPDDG